jgi:hypothetical protein
MKKKILIVVGLALIACSGIWKFAVAPKWTERLPQGWSWKSRSIATMILPDPVTGKLGGGETIATPYVLEGSVIDESERPAAIVVKDRYTAYDAATDTVVWEYLQSGRVDPKTGRHLDPKHNGDYFVFPRNVEKKTYSIRYSFLKGLPLEFQKEETVQGLRAYVFAYKGTIEYTDTYAGTPDYPGVKFEPGQEVRCADDGFVFKTWVEPVSGEFIKLESSCYAGDYLFETATGKKLSPLQIWGGVTAGDEVTTRVQALMQTRMRLLAISLYIPGLLLLAGLVFAGLPLISTFSTRRKDAKTAHIS